MACTDIVSGAGTKIYIAPAANLPATQDQTGWEAVTGWVEIGEVSAIGEYGAESALVTHKGLSGVVCKAKGSVNYGSAQVTVALVPEDAGQVLVQTAVGSKLSFPVKVEYADATATLDVDSVDYFAALFMSFKKNPGSDPDAIITANIQMELNGAITAVARHETP